MRHTVEDDVMMNRLICLVVSDEGTISGTSGKIKIIVKD